MENKSLRTGFYKYKEMESRNIPDTFVPTIEQGGILEKIVAYKQQEIRDAKIKVAMSSLEKTEHFHRTCLSMRDFMLDPARTGIIAEFKRASPSKGIINDQAAVSVVTRQYAAAGASAVSVLTDKKFFGGRMRDLLEARGAIKIPILRKDFIIDEYQIIESKAIGADIILLIASILTPPQIAHFAKLAKGIGLNVLLEVHNQQELDQSIVDDLDAIGVNNRNLDNFTVSVQNSYDLVKLIPDQFLKISESGISDPQTIIALKKAGFNGFLIGENFMKHQDPGLAIQEFVNELKAD
ncbi:Indole-3-glycerol phosphate synthase [Arcticibacter svalbardensis MN12-7]|uniref:Indole-3-glycerol phosphate synthase n=1 Tax=Arcticibacter svalbardensis MN12-7 TaxID=1150600 RepID=R9GVY5_9SPHI|nr:indole-3-glycerol phosphate synthase TrpC [Arcticibacter svalbardensis]EOR93089.1 Indole-3-glycerol phosphate synthase [Arcticibacter svalbardensis MN12-7]